MRPRTSVPDRVGFRAEAAADESIVRAAHVAHRASLFAHAGLPTDALRRLCEQQHDLQERHIGLHNPRAERRMIVATGETIGRLCLDRTAAMWRIVDVALLPDAQGRGHGGEALRLVLAEAATVGARVDLMVGRDNPRAEALYRRLGFVDAVDASAMHRRLVWCPDPVDGSAPPRRAVGPHPLRNSDRSSDAATGRTTSSAPS